MFDRCGFGVWVCNLFNGKKCYLCLFFPLDGWFSTSKLLSQKRFFFSFCNELISLYSIAFELSMEKNESKQCIVSFIDLRWRWSRSIIKVSSADERLPRYTVYGYALFVLRCIKREKKRSNTTAEEEVRRTSKIIILRAHYGANSWLLHCSTHMHSRVHFDLVFFACCFLSSFISVLPHFCRVFTRIFLSAELPWLFYSCCCRSMYGIRMAKTTHPKYSNQQTEGWEYTEQVCCVSLSLSSVMCVRVYAWSVLPDSTTDRHRDAIHRTMLLHSFNALTVVVAVLIHFGRFLYSLLRLFHAYSVDFVCFCACFACRCLLSVPFLFACSVFGSFGFLFCIVAVDVVALLLLVQAMFNLYI